MKKIFTLIISLCALSSVFAQNGGNYSQRNDRNYPQQTNDRNVVYQDRNQQPNYGRGSNDANYGRSNDATYARNDQQNNRGYGERQRPEEMDRTNHDYDNRMGGYRNDRGVDNYERSRRIEEPRRDRNGRLKTIGGAVLVGGILGVLIGSHL